MQSIQSVSIWKILGSFLAIILCFSEAQSTYEPVVEESRTQTARSSPKALSLLVENPSITDSPIFSKAKSFIIEPLILPFCMGILAYSFYNRSCFFEFWALKKPFEFMAGEVAGFLTSSRFPNHWAIPLIASILLSYFGGDIGYDFTSNACDFISNALAFTALLL